MSCAALSHERVSQKNLSPKQEAEKYLEAGELYRARQVAETMRVENPSDPELENLMARILEKEVERQKETFEEEAKPRAEEEKSSEEQNDEVRTWLERAEALMELKAYDEALEAAEKVFMIDAYNEQASQLIDKIRQRAYSEGKKENLLMRQMTRDEMKMRIETYHHQMTEAIANKKWGQAKIAVHKTLLLSPEDSEALKWQAFLSEQDKQGR